MVASESGALRAEVAELQALLVQSKTPGNVRDLQQLLAHKQRLLTEHEEAQRQQDAAAAAPVEEEEAQLGDAAPAIPQSAPVKVAAYAVKDSSEVDDLNVYTEISRFGWEDEGYGKDKVSVYVMSGVDGVGDLPKENVSCKFTKNSFDLKILGLHEKNYRLVKTYLEKEIVSSKSSFRVKKNRVTITLWKADKNSTWMSLTEKNPGKSLKPNADDPAAGIMDMMKNMYEEGDDDMKRTIAKAWTESRQKNAAAGF
uniref:Calcyclin-binding protein n=1 Tax=Globisporangium ultimum (strain ATCC 200006 / CBS 805.95 / DAOM BR144) TaxID=431595 RepID=K3WRB9_GLOUD